MIASKILPAVAGIGMFAAVTAAQAADMATGDQIQAAISDSTVAGTMFDSGDYAEFYAADGTIRGDGYTGTWSVDGDTMCFDYGEGADCWNVSIDGANVQWIQDGEVKGDGAISEGNVNNF